MKNIQYRLFTAFDKANREQVEEIVAFLFEQLEYQSERTPIRHAIDYALKEIPSLGGVIVTVFYKNQLIGASIVNQTGMGGYFPENILAFIAIHKDFRRKGLGRKLFAYTMKVCKGDVFVSLDPKNSAIEFFQKLGFESNSWEMRYKRASKPSKSRAGRTSSSEH